MLHASGEIINESEKSLFTKVCSTSPHPGIPLILDELLHREWVTFEVQELQVLLLYLFMNQFCKQIKGKPNGFVRRCLVWMH